MLVVLGMIGLIHITVLVLIGIAYCRVVCISVRKVIGIISIRLVDGLVDKGPIC
jgi:hypothetical protein